MADQTTTAETGTHNTAVATAAKAAFVNFDLAGAALLHTNLEKSCRWVLVALCSYANRAHYQAWPSVSSLAERAGCSERTARAQLRYLERAGYIRTVRNGAYSTTAYQIEATKLQLDQATGTATTPFFGLTEIAGGAAKTVGGAAKTVTQHAEIAAKERKEERKEERIEERKEEGGNAHAHATPLASLSAEPTFQPLPSSVFENLPALNSPAVARSTTPATCTAAAPATTTLPTSASSNATATAHPQAATPAPSVDTLIDLPPAPSNNATSSNTAADTAPALPAPVAAQPEATPATAADVLPAQTVAAINAQRAKNGKGKLTQKDLATLAAEAAAACITPAQAAAWMLAKPTRNFFKADWYKPTSAPAPAAAAEEPSLDAKRAAATLASMIPPAPQTDAEIAAAAAQAAAAKARARQIREELEAKQAAAQPAAPAAVPTAPAAPVPATTTGPSAHDLAVARQLAQRCADSNRTSGNVAALFTGTSAAPITTAPAAPTGPAAGLLPEVGPKGWAGRIVNRALRGQHVNRGPLEEACKVVGVSFASVQASRAALTGATA